jgi:hypothetical protein
LGWLPNGAPGAGLAVNVRPTFCWTVSMLETVSSSVLATSRFLPIASRALGCSPTGNVLTCWPLARSTSETVPVEGTALELLVTMPVP